MEGHAVISIVCERHGRDPATLRRKATVTVLVPGHAYAVPGAPLIDTPEEIAGQFASFAEHGARHICNNAQPKTPGRDRVDSAGNRDNSRMTPPHGEPSPQWARDSSSARRRLRTHKRGGDRWLRMPNSPR